MRSARGSRVEGGCGRGGRRRDARRASRGTGRGRRALESRSAMVVDARAACIGSKAETSRRVGRADVASSRRTGRVAVGGGSHISREGLGIVGARTRGGARRERTARGTARRRDGEWRAEKNARRALPSCCDEQRTAACSLVARAWSIQRRSSHKKMRAHQLAQSDRRPWFHGCRVVNRRSRRSFFFASRRLAKKRRRMRGNSDRRRAAHPTAPPSPRLAPSGDAREPSSSRFRTIEARSRVRVRAFDTSPRGRRRRTRRISPLQISLGTRTPTA